MGERSVAHCYVAPTRSLRTADADLSCGIRSPTCSHFWMFDGAEGGAYVDAVRKAYEEEDDGDEEEGGDGDSGGEDGAEEGDDDSD